MLLPGKICTQSFPTVGQSNLVVTELLANSSYQHNWGVDSLMDALIGLLLTALGGTSVIVVLVLLLVLNPEKVEIWSSIVLSWLGGLFKGLRRARKQAVKLGLQGRINHFSKSLANDAPYLSHQQVAIEWVDSSTSRKAFLEDGKAILRLRAEDRDETNFVHGAYMIVSTSLLSKVRKFIAPTQREAVNLYVTTKLFQEEKQHVVELFLDEYLHPELDQNKKIAAWYDTFSRLDQAGYFFPVMLQELHFLGNKVFGGPIRAEVAEEITHLIRHLVKVADRTLGREADLTFEGDYCRSAILIIGKPHNVEAGGNVWVNYVNQKIRPKNIETLYIMAPSRNRDVVDTVCRALGENYETYRSRTAQVKLKRADGTLVSIDQYFVIMRMKGVPVVQLRK
jgi:hypothetical protein